MEGTVKWFNRKKGFGFIKGDDDEDYFVHYTAMPQDMVLNENDRVTFDAADTDKGKQAQNVAMGGGEAPQSEEPSEAPKSEESEDFKPEEAEKPKEPEEKKESEDFKPEEAEKPKEPEAEEKKESKEEPAE